MGLKMSMGLIYGAGANLWGQDSLCDPSMGPVYGARSHYGANLWGWDPLWGQSMGPGPAMGPIYGAGADVWGRNAP